MKNKDKIKKGCKHRWIVSGWHTIHSIVLKDGYDGGEKQSTQKAEEFTCNKCLASCSFSEFENTWNIRHKSYIPA